MKKLFWTMILLAGIALGGLSVWYFINGESAGESGSPQAVASQPRLIAEPSKADSSHIPRGEIVDKAIEENTKAEQIPEKPTPIEKAGQVVEAVIETGVQTAGTVVEAVAETAMEVIEVPAAVVQEVTNLIDPRPAIAVVPFKVMGDAFNFNKDTGDILCDAFVSEIDSQQYQIYERGQLASLLEEKGFQASLLVDNTTSAAKFGRLAKVQYLVLGSVAKLGGRYQLSARVVDCTTGRLGRRGWVVFDSMREWPNKVPELINLLGLRSGTEYSDVGDMDNDLIDTINPDADFEVQIRTAQNKQAYLEGEYIKFIVTAEKDCFITLITVDSAGEMTLLLPNKWQRRAFLRRGTSITIPTDEMGFRFPIQPPHGEAMVKAIATLQPLKLSGVNTKSIGDEGFVTLEKGVKAIGVEAVGSDTSLEFIDGGSIAELLKPGQWATGELIVITARDKTASEQPKMDKQKASAGGASVPFDFDYVGDDINEKIAHRYQQLIRDTLEPSQIILHQSPEPLNGSNVDEYLVFQQGGCDFIKVKASQVGQYENNVVVPNIKLYSFSLPSTRLVEVQWALDNRFGKGGDLGIAQRYDELRKKSTKLIGLVDGPVDWQDQRISHAAWVNSGEIANNGIDDDGNGFVDDMHGWNFRDNCDQLCGNPYQFNHGTALVSVMAAKPTGSDQDVIGIAPQAKIVAAVVLADAGEADNWILTGDLDDIIKAIKYVADCGAKVINCSFGVRVTRDQLNTLSRIPLWDELESNGVLLICAAGNDNIDIDQHPVFPACLPGKNIIAVGATDAANRDGRYFDTAQKKWFTFTNFGKNTIDTKTPGTLILAGGQRGKTSLQNGTSYSAAMVSVLKSFE